MGLEAVENLQPPPDPRWSLWKKEILIRPFSAVISTRPRSEDCYTFQNFPGNDSISAQSHPYYY
jgi:hypothetical protein